MQTSIEGSSPHTFIQGAYLREFLDRLMTFLGLSATLTLAVAVENTLSETGTISPNIGSSSDRLQSAKPAGFRITLTTLNAVQSMWASQSEREDLVVARSQLGASSADRPLQSS